MSSSKTRLEATADAVADFIMSGTGVKIRQPPLNSANDCTVRVIGDRAVFCTLDGKHAERQLRLAVYCKASGSRTGIRTLTSIQDRLNNTADHPQVSDDLTNIQYISAGDVSEDNLDGEWIYQMIVTVGYFY